MNCPEAQSWLLAARETADLPAAVRRHLRDCPRCQRRWRQLSCLAVALADLPGRAGSAAARQRFLRGPFAAERDRWPRRLPGWRTWLGVAAALVLLTGLVFWLLPPRSGPSTPAAVTGAFPDEAALQRQLSRNLRLARSGEANERARFLADTADDLAAAALAAAGQDMLDGLPVLAELYRFTVHGLAALLRGLPRAPREKLAPELLARLRRHAEEADRAAAGRLPAVSEQVRLVGSAAREGARALSAEEKQPALPAPAPAVGDDPRQRLVALVRQAVRLADEPTPLRRAECCVEVADYWSQAILFAAARGEEDQAARLGGQLGALLEQGVVPNVEQAATASDPATHEELERLAGRSERAATVLRRNLEQAPPPARRGLERALEASARGWQLARRPPGWRGKDLPPGWQKRKDRPLPPGLERKDGKGPPPGKGRGHGHGKGRE